MNYIINKKVHGCNYWLNFFGDAKIVWEGLRENAHVFSNYYLAQTTFYRAAIIGNKDISLQYENGDKVDVLKENESIRIEQELQPNYGYQKKVNLP